MSDQIFTCNNCKHSFTTGYFFPDFGLCWKCGRDIHWAYHMKQVYAHFAVYKAIKAGKVSRPDTCELCGAKPAPVTVTDKNGDTRLRSLIVAHHWRGYDHPLDVWWICCKCNGVLDGMRFHNGTVSRDEARKFITESSTKPPKPLRKQCEYVFPNGRQCRCFTGRDGSRCGGHRRPSYR